MKGLATCVLIGTIWGGILPACGSTRAVYKYQLKQVMRGDALADESAKIQKPLVFENADFRISWSPGVTTYYFRIENKGKAELQVNFSKSFLISPAGNAFNAVHPGNSALRQGDDFIIIPVQVGIDSWIRPGEKQGQNNSGLAGQISPGFDASGFFPATGEVNSLKSEYSGKTAVVVLNIVKSGKSENFRFGLQVADVIEE